MNRLFIAVTLFLAACSGQQSGDLGAFLVQHATKLGARVERTSGLPKLQAHWYYKEDPNSLQIYISGDRVSELQSLLGAAFGAGSGVDISYTFDVGNGGKERVTNLTVVRKR